MTKRFFRTSIGSIFFQIITILFLLSDIFFCVKNVIMLFFNDSGNCYLNVFAIVTLCFGIPLFSYIELTFLIGNIILNSQKIYTKGDIKLGRSKIQYPTSIDYSRIAGVSIIALQKDSKGKNIALSRPIPYLVVTDKDGNVYRFGLYLMSKKTVHSLLIDLRGKCENEMISQMDVEKLLEKFVAASFATNEK